VVLHLTDDEFYSLTPRQYHALLDQHEHQRAFHEFLFGQVCSTVANWSMASPKEPLQPRQFMPSEWSKEEPVRKKSTRKADPQALADKIRLLFKDAVTTHG